MSCEKHKSETKFPPTVDALEVEQVGPVVHLVQLQAHLHQVPRHRVLSPHPQMIRIHHLRHKKKMLHLLQ